MWSFQSQMKRFVALVLSLKHRLYWKNVLKHHTAAKEAIKVEVDTGWSDLFAADLEQLI